MGLFDMFKNNKQPATKQNNIESTSLQTCIKKLNEYGLAKNEDTVTIKTSQWCTKCCIYNKRVFSIYGNDKRFPYLFDMPPFLLKKVCPECETVMIYTMYFSGIQNKSTLNKDIKFSNRPFVDDSPSEIVEHRKQLDEQSAKWEQEENEFDWITQNLPDIAPKSLSGYKKMKNSNSKNYQNIVIKAKEKGFIIK